MSETSGRKRRGRGEGGVRYDEKRKLWVASLSLGFLPDGRRNRPVAYAKTKREALEDLDRLKREAAVTPASALTVGELLDLWLDAKRGKIADGTQDVREEASARVRAALGTLRAADLTPLRISQWHA